MSRDVEPLFDTCTHTHVVHAGRDSTLALPRLILPSIQVNIRASEFPPTADNGVSWLGNPLNAL